MTEVLSRPNSLQTQPLRDSLHRPQVPGSVVQAEGQATYSASTPASWRWWPQQKQTEDFHVAPQAHHRGDAPAEEPRGPICEGDGRRQEDPGANPADQGDAQEPAGPRSRSSATKSATLAKLNDELLRIIQDVEDSTALNVRELLHQQDTLANVVNILEYSNKRRLQQLKSEIQEWEEKENQKMSCLERQVQHLEAQNKKTQDQVNFLSTYMDHEYPVKLVQLASLGRQVQQAKDRQQHSHSTIGDSWLLEVTETRKKREVKAGGKNFTPGGWEHAWGSAVRRTGRLSLCRLPGAPTFTGLQMRSKGRQRARAEQLETSTLRASRLERRSELSERSQNALV
uniref:Chromosome 20 open reading frame 96 n=1 Tax=Oryctolagus cuniculus TaxID=9986 RepID=A0A5F9CJB8_RABIT